MSSLVIIGASYAGIQAALGARSAGYAEPIRVISDEHSLPYERPPLSKDFLLGSTGVRDLMLRDHAFYAGQGIDLVMGRTAIGIDRRGRRIALAGGGTLDFDNLVVATGSRARHIAVPGCELDGVCYLRSIAD